MLTITGKSHLDHDLGLSHIRWILEEFGGRDSFFKVTLELPDDLSSLTNGLHGPLCGDDPIEESEVFYLKRGDDKDPTRGLSRMTKRKTRKTRLITIIAGPFPPAGLKCMLYTSYGGKCAPQEPHQDKSIEAKLFWQKHALSE